MKKETKNSKLTQPDTELAQFDMKIFADRLRAVMIRDGVTQQQLAEKLGSKRQTISQYVNGTIQPNIGKLFEMADIFKVSADYLLGLSDMQCVNVETQGISKVTGLSEHSIAVLRNETEYVCNFSKKQTPQEALKYMLEKYNDEMELPRFQIINLLLNDYPIDLNYAPIIEVLGEILEFRLMQQNNDINEEYYGLFKKLRDEGEEEIFDTGIAPRYRLDYNDILELLLFKLQGTIKRYKDEHKDGEL